MHYIQDILVLRTRLQITPVEDRIVPPSIHLWKLDIKTRFKRARTKNSKHTLPHPTTNRQQVRRKLKKSKNPKFVVTQPTMNSED